MAVYVDPIFGWPHEPDNAQAARLHRRNDGQWSHMIGDTPEELHAFAKGLGLKREWSQEWRSGGLHYDLTPSKRAAAVRKGALEIVAHDLPLIVDVLNAFDVVRVGNPLRVGLGLRPVTVADVLRAFVPQRIAILRRVLPTLSPADTLTAFGGL